MSWTDAKKPTNSNQTQKDTNDSKNDLLTDSQKIELLAQTIDQLATENETLLSNINKNLKNNQDWNKQLNQNTNQLLSDLEKKIETLDQVSKTYEKQVATIVRWKTLAKHFLELLLYIGAVVLLIQALTSSLWETMGFKMLAHEYEGEKNVQLAFMIVYTLIILGFLVWIIRKMIKSSRDY